MPLPMTDAPRTEAAEPASADAELVRRASAGDMRAFETLYRRHAPRVHGAVWRLSGMNRARAEELTQEAFVRAWQKLASFRFESAFSTWLHRLAVNVALMDLRGRDPEDAVEQDVLEAAAEPVTPFCAGERADRPADHGADRAADEAAEGRAGQLQNERRHQSSIPGKRKAKAMWRRHQGPMATSATAAPSWAWIMQPGALTMPTCLAGRCARQRKSRTSPVARAAGATATRWRRAASSRVSRPPASAQSGE